MFPAVLGKTSTLHFAKTGSLVDLTPDYGGWSFDGTANTEAVEAAEQDGVDRILLSVDHAIGIDSLRYSRGTQAPNLVGGSKWQMVGTLGGGAFRSLIQQPVIVAGNGTSTPTDNLVEINLAPEADGPWLVGLGQTRPEDAAAGDDATGAAVFALAATEAAGETESNMARSPAGETQICWLVLNAAAGVGVTWQLMATTADGRNLATTALPNNRFSSLGIVSWPRPEGWADEDVNWRLKRTTPNAGGPAGEIWLLGSRTKGG